MSKKVKAKINFRNGTARVYYDIKNMSSQYEHGKRFLRNNLNYDYSSKLSTFIRNLELNNKIFSPEYVELDKDYEFYSLTEYGNPVYSYKKLDDAVDNFLNYDGSYELYKYELKKDSFKEIFLVEIYGFDYTAEIGTDFDEKIMESFGRASATSSITENIESVFKAEKDRQDETKIEESKQEIENFQNKVNEIIKKNENRILKETKSIRENPSPFCGFVLFKTKDENIKRYLNILNETSLHFKIPVFDQSLDVNEAVADSIIKILKENEIDHIYRYVVYD